MSEIPMDIILAVRAVLSMQRSSSPWETGRRLDERIGCALMAERERCAKVADDMAANAVSFMKERLGGYDNDFQRFADGCSNVAHRIRHPDTEDTANGQ